MKIPSIERSMLGHIVVSCDDDSSDTHGSAQGSILPEEILLRWDRKQIRAAPVAHGGYNLPLHIAVGYHNLIGILPPLLSALHLSAM
jgi:hypothetical protein